jgi:hypothetical protein
LISTRFNLVCNTGRRVAHYMVLSSYIHFPYGLNGRIMV